MLDTFWYVGCASAELGEVPIGLRLLDTELVLFRNAAGQPVALADRCCHRGYPLRFGCVTAGRIKCGFHGWEYDDQGQVASIPSRGAAARIPNSFRIARYFAQELNGFVWVALKPALQPVGIPDFDAMHWHHGSSEVATSFDRALEVTFDESHVYFAHPTHPSTVALERMGFRETHWRISETPRGCFAAYPAESPDGGDYLYQMEFRIPNEVHITARTTSGSEYRIFTHVVPVGPRQCRVEWLCTRPGPGPTLVHTETAGIAPVVAEDRRVLERCEPAYDSGELAAPCAAERSVEADAPALMLRRALKSLRNGIWPPADWGRSRVVSFWGVGANQHSMIGPRRAGAVTK